METASKVRSSSSPRNRNPPCAVPDRSCVNQVFRAERGLATAGWSDRHSLKLRFRFQAIDRTSAVFDGSGRRVRRVETDARRPGVPPGSGPTALSKSSSQFRLTAVVLRILAGPGRGQCGAGERRKRRQFGEHAWGSERDSAEWDLPGGGSQRTRFPGETRLA